jgi:DNA ligase (NAD+)
MKYMENFRETCEFQLDGVVFALPTEFREIFGENDHDPEWSIAVKFVPEEVITPVIGVQWNLGKTGELTPVVCLKPVQLAGTTVKRASGYNAGYIVKNRIQEGSIVSLHKSGDIIPEISKVIYSPE